MVRGQSVKKHPDLAIIKRMLLSGWRPPKIFDWLVKHKKPTLSVKTLTNFRDNYLDVKQILPTSVYEEKLKEVDIFIDSLQELYNLIAMQKERIGYLLNIEDKSKIALPDTREELKILRDLLIKIVQLEMELGIRDKRPIEIIEKKFDMTEMLKEWLSIRETLEKAIEP